MLAVATSAPVPTASRTGCPFAQALTDPPADDFNPLSTDDPEQTRREYDVLRKQCPVAYTSAYGGYYLLTRYEDVKNAATNPGLFINSVKA